MKIRFTALLLIVSLLLFAGCTAAPTESAENPKDTTETVQTTPDEKVDAQEGPQSESAEPIQPEETPETPESEPISDTLTREDAIAAALEAAVLTEDDVLYIWAEYELDDGIPEYEVEFRTADTEYDFTIHAETGAILSRDQEVEHITQSGDTIGTEPLTEAKVIAIALADANLSEADVMNLHVEYDAEDDDYEVEFYYDRMEYTYEIDAKNGTILDSEIDD